MQQQTHNLLARGSVAIRIWDRQAISQSVVGNEVEYVNDQVQQNLLWETDPISQSIKYFGIEGSLPLVEKLMSTLQSELEGLHDQAQQLADEYWTTSREINKTKKTSEKTKLGIRARKKTKVVTIEWYFNRWVFNGKSKNPLSSYIPKGSGSGYRVESILKHAQDWERDSIIETEARAARIREQSVQRVLLMAALEKYIDSQT